MVQEGWNIPLNLGEESMYNPPGQFVLPQANYGGVGWIRSNHAMNKGPWASTQHLTGMGQNACDGNVQVKLRTLID